MRIIETTADLQQLCTELKTQEFITVDSEFVREKSYYPKLCLIQVGWLDDAAIIDPLAPGLDLSSFLKIMQAENVLKVFHSGRQDIEIFYNLSGKVPSPVFDTQIAAMACGFGASVSYDNMVHKITGVELDKSSRLTDWSKRPLDNKQLEYALRDVTFLLPCYQYLRDYMREHGRTHWIDEEMAALRDENLYRIDPDMAWLKIRHSVHSAHFLRVLKDLAAWRERRAIKHNTPRQSVVKDDMLVNIASVAPRTVEELQKARYIHKDIVNGKLGQEIIEAVREAMQKPLDPNLRKIDRAKQVNIPGAASALAEVLMLLLKIKSEQLQVVPHLIANEKNLRDIACGNDDKTNPALLGWRYDVFGKEALAFRKGLATISYDTNARDIVINIAQNKL